MALWLWAVCSGWGFSKSDRNISSYFHTTAFFHRFQENCIRQWQYPKGKHYHTNAFLIQWNIAITLDYIMVMWVKRNTKSTKAEEMRNVSIKGSWWQLIGTRLVSVVWLRLNKSGGQAFDWQMILMFLHKHCPGEEMFTVVIENQFHMYISVSNVQIWYSPGMITYKDRMFLFLARL